MVRAALAALVIVTAPACHESTGYTWSDGRSDPPTTGPVAFHWSWTIEGHDFATTDYDALCAWAGWGSATVRLIVDIDFDTHEDYYYDAECLWGAADTVPAMDPADYESGQVIWFAFQFLDSEHTVIARSAEYVEVTLHPGMNDLGEVDFDFGDYGPLDVTVQWADGELHPTYGGCDLPPDPVAYMGYLLRYSTGEVADEVDIDTAPMDCTTDLSWIMTEYDTYTLVIDGEAAGYDYWGSTCIDLVVDDDVSNSWLCEVFMNPID